MVRNERPDKTASSRTVLITGCSSGIGRYCALELKKLGWEVFATARKPSDIEQLDRLGLKAMKMDYRDPSSIAACADRVLEQTAGELYAVFQNGGHGQPGAVEDVSSAALREVFESNFFGWHDLNNRLLPTMRNYGRGRIVFCSSVLGFAPYPWRGAYNATKHAIEGLAKTMRLELQGTGIAVSIIQPGPIATDFSRNALLHLKEKIDWRNSIHSQRYRREIELLSQGGKKSALRLPPSAVYKKLLHALTSQQPKPLYRVTLPTHMLAWAIRLLPGSAVDRILVRFGQ